MGEFKMPSLGADMEAGTLIEWRIKPGDTVKRGDVVAVVDTSKAAIEVEIWESGVVGKLLVEPGTRVPVGAVLALIGAEGEEMAAAPAPAAAAAAEAHPEVAAASVVARPEPAAGARPPARPGAGVRGGRLRMSPAARRLAATVGMDAGAVAGSGPDGAVLYADVEAASQLAGRPPHVTPLAKAVAAELGVPLAGLRGSGAGGAITRADVERAAAARAQPREAAAPPVERVAAVPRQPEAAGVALDEDARAEEAAARAVERGTAMRAAIAAAMARSKREIPHYYLSEQVELTSALTWLEEENRRRSVAERLLPAVLLIKATALALRGFPDMNGFFLDNAFRPSQAIHVGVAVSLRGGGLVAPAMHDTDQLTLSEVMAALRDLVARTRAGRLRSSEMSDPTITVSNLGDQGVESLFGIIYPPQVALVGFGRISARPFIHDDALAIRRGVTLTLAADHRASDGHRGALFLAAIARLLGTPEAL